MPPAYCSKNKTEVAMVICEVETTGKLTVAFTVEWPICSSGVTLSSDDSTLDVTYSEGDNTSMTVNLINNTDLTNSLTITNDETYGVSVTLNFNALTMIGDLNATGSYTFSALHMRFTESRTKLEVSVEVINIQVYFGSESLTSITSTIDYV